MKPRVTHSSILLKQREVRYGSWLIQHKFGGPAVEKHEEVLVALRQIIRAIDLHSKKLNKDAGLTGPQLILMRSIHDLGEVTIRELAVHTNMSQGTATTILDRLERNGYVQRVRSNSDKRKVHAHLTDEGRKLLAQAPQPLQENFVEQFHQLQDWEQSLLLSSVQRISAMMNAQDMDAAPMLTIGSITQPE
ncbi:transcriptional regulator MarR family protein [Vibrio mimicus]|nr:transcriptional regulator MarR family protein [Vibrio mimicus]